MSSPRGANRGGETSAWGAVDRARFLASVPLFRELPAGTLAEIASRFRVHRYGRGEFVFLAGDAARAMGVLGSGRIKLIREMEDGRDAIVRLIRAGEMFGAAGGWGGAEYPASAVAQDEAVVLRLPAEELMALLRSQADFAIAVIREQGRRLAEAAARIEDLRLEQVDRRIARTLMRLSSRFGSRGERGVTLTLSRQDLAELAGTTLSTASRTISAWAREGIVAGGRERIILLDAEALTRIAGASRATDRS
ncbi:MAG: Crp/Fnr family transcriptional regulator [Chloroflexota bacterium]